MLARLGALATLVVLYFVGQHLGAAHAAHPEAQGVVWTMTGLMLVTFLVLVALMYTRVLPALLALPILAIALASIAGVKWDQLFTTVIADGSMRLKTAIIAAILGAILAQIVEKTGIAQTAIKKTAELGGDRPMVLAVFLTLVIAVLFLTLGGLGAVIMVATIAIPIMLSLGLRPLYVGCLFLLAMSLGGAFNLANWALFKTALGMTNLQIGYFAVPFAAVMLLFIIAFMIIEGKRMGKARYSATVEETATPHAFVPWYALLTPLVPLVPVLLFIGYSKIQPAVLNVYVPPAATVQIVKLQGDFFTNLKVDRGADIATIPIDGRFAPRAVTQSGWFALDRGNYVAEVTLPSADGAQASTKTLVKLNAADVAGLTVTADPQQPAPVTSVQTTGSNAYDFPIPVAMLLGIIYGAIVTWRRGQSTVQLVTKASFDGVAAVGPAVVLMIGIGMVFIATKELPQVSSIIGPAIGKLLPVTQPVPGITPEAPMTALLHYVLLFGILAPLALYRGPLNLWGMGAGLIGLMTPFMPAGAIMGAFMSTGMVQGVCDPTNTHNVWIANYTNTDVQDILKRTLPYMWVLAFVGLAIAGVMYYLVK